MSSKFKYIVSRKFQRHQLFFIKPHLALGFQVSIAPNVVEAVDDETESLDEACPSDSPVRLVRRPRLAILLQACKAVVGAGQHWSDFKSAVVADEDDVEAPAGRQQVQTQAATQVGRGQHVEHYESPLIAKLRQVEVSN